MTDFARRPGDMFKSDYDTNDNNVVNNAEKLAGSTKGQVQNHTPQTHTHTESQITNLDHDADKIKAVVVDDTAKANGKVLTYNSTTPNLEYKTPFTAGNTYIDRGDPDAYDFTLNDFTTDTGWCVTTPEVIFSSSEKTVTRTPLQYIK